MKTFTYKQSSNIRSTEDIAVLDQNNVVVAIVSRVYDNRLKKLLDGYFDYRYFLKYVVKNSKGDTTFFIKKIFRRGKVWFEAEDHISHEKYTISYENWRIGIPELYIHSNNFKMKIDKAMEGWSEYSVDGKIIARWQAVYDEAQDLFYMTLQIEEQSPIQTPDFFIGISQATLFIGT
ncbi:peptide ABC transporter ATPase [Solibacillus sp. CAU 1738]|uniref:tubby C-terminal domain-like protein n=1 Tax=Solibacillus sp. CAU 1738 TaxID=3140363 RepID=UPI0032608BB5